MKNIFKPVLALAALLILLPSCKKEEVREYHGPAAINMSVETADFSFLLTQDDEYDFPITLNLLGYKSDKVRTVKFIVLKEGTDAPESGYELPAPVALAKDETSAETTFKVKKSALGEENTLTVMLAIDPSGDFVGGNTGVLKLTFTQAFPASWYSSGGYMVNIDSFLGQCTKAKYKLVLSYIGTIDLVDYEGMWDAYYLKADLNKAIAEHNAKYPNDKLKDDDGSDLGF